MSWPVRAALFSVFALPLLAACEAADPSNRLAGVWEMTGPDGELGECPDVIAFERDGVYQIWNECYGPDPDDPLVETGLWRFDSAVLLHLSGRDVLTRSESPWGNDTDLDFLLIELSDATLRFAVDGRPDGVEHYRRVAAR